MTYLCPYSDRLRRRGSHFDEHSFPSEQVLPCHHQPSNHGVCDFPSYFKLKEHTRVSKPKNIHNSRPTNLRTHCSGRKKKDRKPNCSPIFGGLGWVYNVMFGGFNTINNTAYFRTQLICCFSTQLLPNQGWYLGNKHLIVDPFIEDDERPAINTVEVHPNSTNEGPRLGRSIQNKQDGHYDTITHSEGAQSDETSHALGIPRTPS